MPTHVRTFAGLKLRELRQSAGMSQVDLGKVMSQLGFRWSQVTVTDSERARRGLSLDEVNELARLFGVEVNVFFPTDEQARDVGGA